MRNITQQLHAYKQSRLLARGLVGRLEVVNGNMVGGVYCSDWMLRMQTLQSHVNCGMELAPVIRSLNR